MAAILKSAKGNFIGTADTYFLIFGWSYYYFHRQIPRSSQHLENFPNNPSQYLNSPN